jgi:glycerol uptake facilitator-like aquaporin
MEIKDNKKNKLIVCIFEALGTATLLIAINWGANGGAQAYAVGITIFANIMFFGAVSGGHFNPAVTIGVYIREGDYGGNAIFMLLIIASQLIGASFGCVIARLGAHIINDDTSNVNFPKLA